MTIGSTLSSTWRLVPRITISARTLLPRPHVARATTSFRKLSTTPIVRIVPSKSTDANVSTVTVSANNPTQDISLNLIIEPTVSKHNHGTASPKVTLDVQSKSVLVTWASGLSSQFHNIWLRDHCRCPQCYHPKTKQRLLNTFQIPVDIQPRDVESTTEGLLVYWPPLASSSSSSTTITTSAASTASVNGSTQLITNLQDHVSLYPWRWLMDNSYAPVLSDPIGSSSSLQATEKVLWGKGIGASPPTVKFEEVMQSDVGVLKWLNKIAQYGFSFVTGIPPTPNDTEALVRRIAFIRETHYGGFWDFTSDLSHGDTAYTDLALGAHTDTTYFTDPAGLQLFHLLSHTASRSASGPSGGETLLVDGFLAATVLKQAHPEAYEVLSRVRIRAHSAGDRATMIRPLLESGYPILQHDNQGNLVLIRYNNDDRSVLKLSSQDVEPFYDALQKWHDILTNPDGEFWVQLHPGTAVIFDNHRVLHGRSGFIGNRRLCGAYVNHDDYRSRLTVLRAQYGDSQRSVRGVWDDGI